MIEFGANKQLGSQTEQVLGWHSTRLTNIPFTGNFALEML